MRTVGQALLATLVAGLLAAPTIAAAVDTTPGLLPGVDLVAEEVESGSGGSG